MKYSLHTISNNTWAKFSDLNGTIYGVPGSVQNITGQFKAVDVVGLYCYGNFTIIVKDSSSSELWASRIVIIVIVILTLIAFGALLHCIFAGYNVAKYLKA